MVCRSGDLSAVQAARRRSCRALRGPAPRPPSAAAELRARGLGENGRPAAQRGGLSCLRPHPDVPCGVHPGHGLGVPPALPPNCLTSADRFHVVYLLSLDMNFSTVDTKPRYMRRECTVSSYGFCKSSSSCKFSTKPIIAVRRRGRREEGAPVAPRAL